MSKSLISGSQISVNSYTTSDQLDSAVAVLAGGGHVVAWTTNGQDGSAWGVYGTVYDSAGNTAGNFGIPTLTTNSQDKAEITALPDGSFVVVWRNVGTYSDGASYSLYGQRFDASGARLGSQFSIPAQSWVGEPAMTTLSDGRFVVVWPELAGSSGSRIEAQLYSATGVAQGSPFAVSSYFSTGSGDKSIPDVTALADGGFVAVWASNGQDGSGSGVYAQRFNATGARVGTEFRLNSYTTSDQANPVVASLGDGSFVAVWTSGGQDGSSWGQFGRHFAADGTPLGSEFQVNTYGNGEQSRPAITALADGGFLMTWTSSGPDGSGYGIFAQRYDVNCLPVGGEFQVNTVTTGNQLESSVAGRADGGFVVTWTTPDASSSGIAERIYTGGTRLPAAKILGTLGDDALTGGDTPEHIVGLSGNDTLLGNGGADFIDGGDGDDVLDGGVGADTLSGGNGNDIYRAVDSSDTLMESVGGGVDEVETQLSAYTISATIENLRYTGTGAFSGVGNNADNRLTGASGNDTLSSGLGNDTLDGGGGTDTLIGGTGDDVYVVDNVGDVVTELAGEGTDTVHTTLVTYSLGSNVENLTFTGAGDFTGTGNGLANVIQGGSGNDTFDGGAEADTLIGSSGNDTYIVSDIGDVITELAGEGTDEVRTGLASYTLAANVENLVYTGTATFTGIGNTGNNSIIGGTGNDSLTGDVGNDTLDGGSGIDTLIGGSGNDTYIVDNVADVVTELSGEGTDTVRTGLASYTLAANVENLVYTGVTAFTGTGNTGNNSITGGTGSDSLTGGAGNDTMDGGSGADSLIGGTGNDTYIVDDVADVVTELSGEGTDTVRTSLATHTLGANVENLVYTGSGPVTFTGNTLNNSLTGGAGADVLTGLDGNDTLNGGAGADTLIGGAGNDTYTVDNIGDALVEQPGEGTDTVQSSIAHTLLGDFENLTLTGSATISGTGNAVSNLLTGNGAANLLTGLEGDDTLNGGGGADTLVGGIGNDTYIVDNVGDIVTELVGEGIDAVNASIGWTLGANLDTLTLTGTGAINGTGNELNNLITGNSGANLLDGGLGVDTLIGGAGNDVYIVDDAGDVVTELVGQGTDELRTSLSSFLLGDNVEVLTYTGTGDFVGTGNALDNRLTGGGGNDTLSGGDGADTLDGGTGSNLLIGGAGNDVYLVGSLDDQVVELSGEGIDEVRTTLTGYTLADGVETLTYTGAVSFVGNGNTLDNLITGGAGADTLDGGLGADTLIGGADDDVYIVDNVGDVVTELASQGTDELRTSLSAFTLGDQVERLVFQGSGDASGTGNGLDNWLVGNIGNDMLDGGGGNDTLLGGVGTDTLTGGSGADLFAFLSGDGQDTITDFDAAQGDRIGLAVGQTYSVDTNANGDAVIVYGTSDTITLVGIQPAAVSNTWFVTL